ncbi:CD276 antigen homolog [Anabas testudineus]|uniref:Ig-like domain-containing protein n=1 Tax=Anabas testudineus TaxID=64144 RepID=A0A3Q1IDW6_ANATE|nr:CD276 antigen homolog [Anabas testudineus]XP_033182480.1 CD276 antigen homolog [Anabas testudineus]
MIRLLTYPLLTTFVLSFDPNTAQNQGDSTLICSTEKITVSVGVDVVLPCRLQPATDAESMRLEWTRPDLQPQDVHIHQDGRLLFENQNPSYSFRTRLFVDQLINGNVSLKLSRVTLSDTGKYRCYLPSIHQEAVVELSVVKSNVTGSHEPVQAVVGQDVILPCHLEPPFDVTTLRVDWIFNGELRVHVHRHLKDDPDSQHKKFKNRTSLFLDELHQGNISLKLTNVSETDEGNYTCYVPKLERQVNRGSVTLIVDQVEKKEVEQPDPTPSPDPPHLGPGLVAGIVISSLICLVCLAAGFIWWKRERMCPAQNPDEGQDNRPEDVPLQQQGQQ